MPQGSPPREITARVIVLGLLLSVIMGAANVYVGLKVGMTVSASIPAAVVAMLVFRTLFRQSSILEANQVQTAASAGESLAAGIIFTMPALILIGYWQEFDFWMVTLVAFAGGLLGILFMIPMRRVFVSNDGELPYPEGIACAAVLRAGSEEHGGEETKGEAQSLILGGLIGALYKLGSGLFELFHHTLEGARSVGGRILYLGADVSPMLVGVGFIVRLNVAVLIFIGGAIGWLVAIPVLGLPDDPSLSPVDAAYALWSGQVRYIGVGAMVVGGASSIVAVRQGLVAALQHLSGGSKDTDTSDENRDLPGLVILGLGLLSVALIAFLYFQFTEDVTITALSTVVMLVMAFFFTAVASYIVGLVGNSNSPVSGMTITAVLFTGAMLFICGFEGLQGMVATLGVAAVICCVACTSGDVCNDLKTGLMVGAKPFRQQTMQVLGVLVASLVMAPTMALLHEAHGIGSKELAAPQAQLFAGLARGFFGTEEGDALPWNLIGIGAAIGVAILVVDGLLKAKQAGFRAHLMPIAVGMYLPFGLAPPILIGGLLAHFVTRGTSGEETERAVHRGVLFSSGVIAGEALFGVALAGLAVSGVSWALDLSAGVAQATTAVAAIVAVVVFARATRRRT